MSFWVYTIRSETTGKIYIGQTNNLELRLARHNQEIKSRKSSFTHKNSGPWIIIYKESYDTRTAALKREKDLKSHKGRDWLKDNLGALAQG